MKGFTVAFGVGLAGIAVCLIMTVYTGVQEYQLRKNPPPLSIPTPALVPNQ